MSTTAIPNTATATPAKVGKVDMKLEVVTIPVADVDRAKAFYVGLGWRLDADFTAGGEHVVQVTPLWDDESSVCETFSRPTDALRRHAELATFLRESGWLLAERGLVPSAA